MDQREHLEENVPCIHFVLTKLTSGTQITAQCLDMVPPDPIGLRDDKMMITVMQL